MNHFKLLLASFCLVGCTTGTVYIPTAAIDSPEVGGQSGRALMGAKTETVYRMIWPRTLRLAHPICAQAVLMSIVRSASLLTAEFSFLILWLSRVD